LDYSENANQNVLDLFFNDRTPDKKQASVNKLMSPEFKNFLKDKNLKCLLIGLKCICPPSKPENYGNDLRFFNKSARDFLKTEITESF